jgi:hypothetical protein
LLIAVGEGGSGKTMVGVTLAALAARRGHRVVITGTDAPADTIAQQLTLAGAPADLLTATDAHTVSGLRYALRRHRPAVLLAGPVSHLIDRAGDQPVHEAAGEVAEQLAQIAAWEQTLIIAELPTLRPSASSDSPAVSTMPTRVGNAADYLLKCVRQERGHISVKALWPPPYGPEVELTYDYRGVPQLD